MGRPHRRGTDADLDYSYQPYGYQYDHPLASYDDPYPARGRSPGPRRRGRSEPAAPPLASYDDSHRDLEPKKEPRKHRRSRKERMDTAPDDYAPQVEPKPDRKAPQDRYNDDVAYARRARSHGLSTGGQYRAADDREDFDAYAPASRRGRERQHAYHPPRTSETRRSKYPEYDSEPRPSDRRRSRYADYDAEPSVSDKRRSRHVDYDGGVPRGPGESHRSRYTDYNANTRAAPREYASQGRGRYRNDSADRYDQPTHQRSARGRSMPRNAAVKGAASGARPRAKSAVGYAALGEAAQTAFRVGSQAAIKMRDDPGPWIGEKGGRVATAALGAALVDTFIGHKATNMKGGMRHQALRQACEMGISNFVMTPAVNNVNHRTGSGGRDGSGRKRR